MKKIKLLAATLSVGLVMAAAPSVAARPHSKVTPSAPTIVSVTSSAVKANSKVNVTVSVTLAPTTGSAFKSTKVTLVGGKSCTIFVKKNKTSCVLKNLTAGQLLTIQAASKYKTGSFGIKSAPLLYVVGDTFLSPTPAS